MVWSKTGIAYGAFPAGMMREVDLSGTPVLLVRLAEDVHAVGAICSHEGGILADGTLADHRVTCPVHAAAFDVRSGEVLADPDATEPPAGRIDPLTRYPTRVVDGFVEVNLDA